MSIASESATVVRTWELKPASSNEGKKKENEVPASSLGSIRLNRYRWEPEGLAIRYEVQNLTISLTHSLEDRILGVLSIGIWRLGRLSALPKNPLCFLEIRSQDAIPKWTEYSVTEDTFILCRP